MIPDRAVYQPKAGSINRSELESGETPIATSRGGEALLATGARNSASSRARGFVGGPPAQPRVAAYSSHFDSAHASRPVRVHAADVMVLGLYLCALIAAEVMVTFGSPLLVFPLDGGIIALAAMHLGWLGSRDGVREDAQPLRPFLLAVIAITLIRIISLTLPLSSIEPAYRFLYAGYPMMVAALLVARAANLTVQDLGFAWRRWRLQALVIADAVALGFIEFVILKPAAMGGFPWTSTGAAPAIVLGLWTGFPEELIFRGLLQSATRPILGRWNWVYASIVFAVLHIGYRSPVDLVFVFGVGLLYGWVFERTRSIAGISISHGLVNIVLFFVAPNLPWLVDLVGN